MIGLSRNKKSPTAVTLNLRRGSHSKKSLERLTDEGTLELLNATKSMEQQIELMDQTIHTPNPLKPKGINI